MKVGDLIVLKKGHLFRDKFGYGLITKIHSSDRCWAFFPKSVDIWFNGIKWCNNNDLEVVSECLP